MILNERQKKHLRRLAHDRKPVVIIADQGLKETVMIAIEEALNVHELIKIKVNTADKAERQTMIQSICDATGSQLIQHVGFVATLFRRNTQAPKIELNKKALAL